MFLRRRSFPLLRRMLCCLSFASVDACGLRWSFFAWIIIFLSSVVMLSWSEAKSSALFRRS